MGYHTRPCTQDSTCFQVKYVLTLGTAICQAKSVVMTSAPRFTHESQRGPKDVRLSNSQLAGEHYNIPVATMGPRVKKASICIGNMDNAVMEQVRDNTVWSTAIA